MDYQPVLITPPGERVVDVDDMGSHLRVQSVSEDTYIESLIDAAIARLDGVQSPLNVALVSQVWRQSYDQFASMMRLPFGPVSGIGSVEYLDTENQPVSVPDSSYYLMTDRVGPYLEFDDDYSFPSVSTRPGSVSIQFTAGYGDASAVPETFKQMIRLTVGHWYTNREAVIVGTIAAELPLAVKALFEQTRRFV